MTAATRPLPPPQKGSFTETEFELLARTLDGMPADRHPLFLARLVVILSALIADPAVVTDAVERARHTH